MKYLLLLGDGMADHKIKELNYKTPLEVAKKPLFDSFAKNGIMGLVQTIPNGYKPGSDVANLSLMGYNPEKFYTGRSPLEAVNMGVNLKSSDLAIRCNIVSLSNEEIYEEKTMLDYSSSEISTEDAKILLDAIQKELSSDDLNFVLGTSYRHCTIINNAVEGTQYTPPHDITLKNIKNYLPNGFYAERFINLMKKSYDILSKHPLNIERVKKGLNPGNSIWLWGEGRKPKLKSFFDLFNKKASVISAVDLIKGIGKCANMEVLEIEGATGTIHTNYENKAEACIKAFKNGSDFVYLHVEASDECGHQGDLKGKIKAIEYLESRLLKPISNYFNEANEDFAVLIAPDHPTPINIRTHTKDPVPFVIFKSNKKLNTNSDLIYSEDDAKKTNIFFESGPKLLKYFFNEI